MNTKGGLNWMVFLFVPIMIIMLIPISAVVNVMLQVLFDTLDSTTNIHYINLIKFLAGSVMFVITLGVIWTLAGSVRGRDPPPQDFTT